MKNIEKFQNIETYNQLAKYEGESTLVMAITVTDMTEEQKEYLLEELFELSKRLEEVIHANIDVDFAEQFSEEDLF